MMLLRRFFISVAFTAFCLHAGGQQARKAALRLRFVPMLEGKELRFDNVTESSNVQSLQVTTLRCYISGISLWNDEKEVWCEADSYHLVDAEQTEQLTIALNPPSAVRYNCIRFNLGVDSAASCSGARGGDLDPVKGMYWAWQSGYINFKLEGVSPQSTARKHEFHFHLGGYQYPYASIQAVSLPVKPSHEINVRMDLSKFLSGINLAKQNSIMIPGAEAVELSRKAATIFEIQ